MQQHLKKYKLYLSVSIGIVVLVMYYFLLTQPLFQDPYSTVIEAKDGRLLAATIASDGQWRFPEMDAVPEKFEKALLYFEDENFHYHPGVNPFSLARAAWQNLQAGKVVSGGSTITMQLVRLSRKDKPRTLWQKLVELVLATRVELAYSKEDILAMYASHAPFGGNVVGLNAATWRYFNREPYDLSWGEAALLAVLPNSPALIHPGRNRGELEAKRNRLLNKLQAVGIIDSLTNQLAQSESIPDEPVPLPQLASHLLTRVVNDGKKQQRVQTTIDAGLQQKVNTILASHHRFLKANEVHNAAAIVADVNSGQVLAYVGNVQEAGYDHNSQVDIITAARSTGSILKPFLYAAMLDEGQLLPSMLIADVPVFINGFAPRNFSKSYDGAVHADRALARSLNVPAVQMLREYRYEKFHRLLQELGMATLQHSADHYGLALILGGAEGSLWDIAGMYAGMARTLNHYNQHFDSYRYHDSNFRPLSYTGDLSTQERSKTGLLSAASIFHTLNALLEVYRPNEQMSWKMFDSSQKIAWKTGTSFGYRDAWAVGVTSKYVVGVWVGNADGEGRPGLTGIDAAAPIMFDIFDLFPQSKWFGAPMDEMMKIPICRASGYKASEICDIIDTLNIVKSGSRTQQCPFHQLIHLDQTGLRVNSDCQPVAKMSHKAWFLLPPVQEYYYRSKNPSYKKVPPFRGDCGSSNETVAAMELIYPKPHSVIFIPKELDGTAGSAVFEVAHRHAEKTVFWHLNDEFIGSTSRIHQMMINPGAGKYRLTLVDEEGQSVTQPFEVISER
ncbi:Multimodular transpeptidase-transglycosylase [Fulvivirga imtechensis AK7]|uniref:peptidoglycan glycosyltransferase n=1 Tax=Fulvivirga imtechensis AK7 TaxID=1237149 RepID=L8JVB3_9BACT|nr:penicillin-binding protein 1C [Fulvivirga imtechensis]ELR72138.1 Multimodular transpeptidase-transglycosylase [Fulvivirga imtechensis AK7]